MPCLFDNSNRASPGLGFINVDPVGQVNPPYLRGFALRRPLPCKLAAFSPSFAPKGSEPPFKEDPLLVWIATCPG